MRLRKPDTHATRPDASKFCDSLACGWQFLSVEIRTRSQRSGWDGISNLEVRSLLRKKIAIH